MVKKVIRKCEFELPVGKINKQFRLIRDDESLANYANCFSLKTLLNDNGNSKFYLMNEIQNEIKSILIALGKLTAFEQVCKMYIF